MNRKEKIDAIYAHAAKWRSMFEELQDQKMEQYDKQPLDKKTAIVCTGFIVDAIKDLTDATIHIAAHTEQEYAFRQGI